MALTGQRGEVTYTIYYGTKFDDINVPYNVALIRSTSKKQLKVTGQYVWQTTWLSLIKVDLPNDYQDIVGAQYIEMDDTGSTSQGTHWYSVTGYAMESPQTAFVGLLYDSLLSIGLDNISGIKGTMQRWSVTDDTHFKYVNTAEPINRSEKYDYQYYRAVPFSGAGNVVAFNNVVGFPYDMSVAPSVLFYNNPGGAETNVRYPKLVPLGTVLRGPTVFTTSFGTRGAFNDGLRYYDWNPVDGNTVYENYCYALGLQYDIDCIGYKLPQSNHFDLGETDSVGGHSIMQGNSSTYTSGMSLYGGTYNNNKAGDIGITFSLYNELTGDIVSVSNQELSNTNIEISANPHWSGCFQARLSGYQTNTVGTQAPLTSGSVRSVGWPSLTVTSKVGMGTTLSQLNNFINQDAATTVYNNQIESANLSYRTGQTNQSASRVNAATSSLTSLITGNFGGFVNGVVGGLASDAATSINMDDVFNTTLQTLKATRQQQIAELRTQGDLINTVPPAVKLANQESIEGVGYSFMLQKTSISTYDRQRADRFLTAYGYNVNNEMLTSPDQLRNRERFTFIMADDIQITSLASGAENTRVRDQMTVAQIQERFRAGLRIWHVEPDFDYTVPNPVRSN